MHCNFGMPDRRVSESQRLMKQAEKFGRPVITFIDTPGPIPAWRRRKRGQSRPLPAIWRL